MRITHSTEINCPPEQVWPYLEDPEKVIQWISGLREDRIISSGPVGVGTTFRFVVREGRRDVGYEGVVTAYEPYRRMGIRMTGGSLSENPLFVDHRLEDLDGKTRLNYEANVALDGFLVRMMTPAIKLFSHFRLRNVMRSLKRHAEGAAG